ncbi:hypothetical protein ACOME3_004489 [Neoechinorhynchus agilis]
MRFRIRFQMRLRYRRMEDMIVLKKESDFLKESYLNDQSGMDECLKKLRSIAGSWINRVAVEDRIEKDEKRTPQLKLLICDERADRNTIVTVKENGFCYKFDASKIMFSKGNINEKLRMMNLKIRRNEVIIDMFAASDGEFYA